MDIKKEEINQDLYGYEIEFQFKEKLISILILKSKQKREKVRQINSYPFLLPKSYSEPYNYNYQDWFKDQLFACNVQVDFHNYFFLNKF